ncbi:DEKNAAC101945 [Brettanomyces naardenensis]|uniref:DEKNAAC101945 n=1 Tax=Brettanomyces naardenensis TaxID=13370 RepID=A0A448YJI5_BRENA|nr:DEKNAAC101945 [Brettanomyces naardenensis]
MPLILKDLYKHPDVVIDSFAIQLDAQGEKSYLVVRPFLIEIFKFRSGTAEPLLVAHFDSKLRIVAANHVLASGQKSEWIILLNEANYLSVLAPSLDINGPSLVVIQTFQVHDHLNSGKGNVDTVSESITVLSVAPIIEVDSQQRFIILYSCRCFLMVFELRPSKSKIFNQAALNETPRQVLKNKEAALLRAYKVFEDPLIVTIGSSPVEFIKFLPHTSDIDNVETTWFGMVVRDESLRYSLSWYKITKVKLLGVESVKRMTPLDSKPTLICPLPDNALLIVCSSTQYCYPAPDLRMQCDLEGVKIFRSYASKQFVGLDVGNPSFTISSCRVDKDCLLICSQKGDYHLISMETQMQGEEKPNTMVSERLRGENHFALPDGRKNRFELKKWAMSKCGRSELTADYLILTGLKRLVLGIASTASSGIFDWKDPKDTLQVIDNAELLPITFLSFHNAKRIMYAKGTYEGAKLYYGDRALSVTGATIKKVSIVDSPILGLLFVILTESYAADDPNDPDSINVQDRILIYDSNFSKLSSYEFDSGCSCFDLLPLEGLQCYFSEEVEVTEQVSSGLRDKMLDSFLAVSSFVDEMNIVKSDVLLFTVDENGKLELTTTATINRELNYLLKLNERKCILLGRHSMFWISISAYMKASSLSLKFILASRCLGLPCAYITQAEKITPDGKELMVADSFDGLYFVKLHDSEDKVVKVERLLSQINISTFKMIGKDGLVVCDTIGNLCLFQFNQNKCLSMVSEMNLNAGSIGVISTTLTGSDVSLQDVLDNMGIKRPICTVGTNEGRIVEICGAGMSPRLNAVINYQNLLGSMYSNTMDDEQRRESMEIPPLDEGSKLDLKALTKNSPDGWLSNGSFLQQKYIRILPGSGPMRVHHSFADSLPEIPIVDCHYIRSKVGLYRVEEPQEVASFVDSL